ncbi:uncharacterized protein DS421_14g478210 [Arachis hypogaea]|nr:uncharacterized protein DS421_14g478210 [Arachis hypogaea]
MRGHSALLSALVERWRPKTHTFHLPVGEVMVKLEDVSYILGLPINGEAVTGRSDSSHQFLVENCIACFGREPGPDDHVFRKVNIAWVRRCRDIEPCDTQESLERYVRVHIFCVLGTIVFPNKSTVSLNSKFLPLLRNFHRISGYSWGAASLAHLYRSLCRVSRYNCKEMDGPLILLFVWAWERMPFLAPIPRDQLGDIVYMAAIYGSGNSGCPRSPYGYVIYPVASSVIRVHRMAPDRPGQTTVRDAAATTRPRSVAFTYDMRITISQTRQIK